MWQTLMALSLQPTYFLVRRISCSYRSPSGDYFLTPSRLSSCGLSQQSLPTAECCVRRSGKVNGLEDGCYVVVTVCVGPHSITCFTVACSVSLCISLCSTLRSCIPLLSGFPSSCVLQKMAASQVGTVKVTVMDRRGLSSLAVRLVFEPCPLVVPPSFSPLICGFIKQVVFIIWSMHPLPACL